MVQTNSPTNSAANSNQKRENLSIDDDTSDDRISNLPEAILCLILSFLPTRYAVQTCALSKWWKSLWTDVQSLEFRSDLHEEDESTSFEQFVNMVLLLHKARPLNKFCLTWDENPVPFYVIAWISTAIMRNVRVLDICVLFEEITTQFIELPCSLFTSNTLESLELSGDMLVKAPSLVCLPRLEHLKLWMVQYPSDESVRKFIHGCPVLKSLEIARKRYDNVVVFAISSPTLTCLKLYAIDGMEYQEDVNCKLEINAPSLEYLDLCDHVSQDFSLQNVISLVKADVEVFRPDNDQQDYCNSVVRLVQALHCVKILSLSNTTLKVLSNATSQLSTKFLRLTKLILDSECCGWKPLRDLLESSDNLEVLDLRKIASDRGNHRMCWRKPNGVPRCLLSCLQQLSILDFSGCDDELAMIRYILKHGRVLKKLELHPASAPAVTKRYEELIKRILGFDRMSSTCEIEVF